MGKSRGLVKIFHHHQEKKKKGRSSLKEAQWAIRLERDGQAVELEVDEVAGSIASLAAGGDVGAAGLLDGDGDWKQASQNR